MGNDEFEMDSEINRRILATSNYISYDALDKNNIPCSQRGASYYNCKTGAQANPYSRGCSAITRCRSGSLPAIFLPGAEYLMKSIKLRSRTDITSVVPAKPPKGGHLKSLRNWKLVQIPEITLQANEAVRIGSDLVVHRDQKLMCR
nr:hypothetical protein D5086_0000042240 [Populus alba]